MKCLTKLALVALFLFSITYSYATQHTVSNDPNRVAQYTDLQLAIDDAANGDTILVYGSNTQYSRFTTINVYKPLVLIGEGYNGNNSLTTYVSSLGFTRFNSTLSSSGSTLMGFIIGQTMGFDANFTGIVQLNNVS